MQVLVESYFICSKTKKILICDADSLEVINLEEERINREQEAVDRAAEVEISEISTIVPEVIEEVDSKSLNRKYICA